MAQHSPPIDIDVSTMVAWLVDRDKVPAEWQKSLRTVRTELSRAMEEFPPAVLPELQRIVGKDYISYFHVCAIREALATAATREGRGGRNLIGQDRDPATHRWRKLTRAYERKGLYFAEAGRVLAQNVVYALPSGKRELRTLEKQIEGADRRAADAAKSAAGLQLALDAACAELGIGVADVGHAQPKGHLTAALRESLPALAEHLQSVRSAIKDDAAQRAVELYAVMVAHSGGGGGGGSGPALLETMRLLTATDEPAFVLAAADDGAGAEEDDDFGGSGFSMGGSDDDVGFSIGGDDDDDDDVGFSMDDMGRGGDDDDDDDVGFSMAMLEEDDDDDAGLHGDAGAGVAAASSPRSLRNPEVREALVQDALELLAFLQQRRDELGDDDGGTAGRAILAALPASAARQSSSDVVAMIAAVQRILSQLESKQMVHLLRLDSAAYVTRCVSGLRERLKRVEKKKKLEATIMAQRGASAVELKTLIAKQQTLLTASKTLQSEVEQALTKEYAGRPVRLVGAINSRDFV
tara:strand:+ start:17 stop:1585 length:1569 start_codon:yes stop_codon:yes gene_type:complete